MKTLWERQLYRPGLILPMVELIELMVDRDYSLSQVGFVVATRGARAALRRSRALLGGECHD